MTEIRFSCMFEKGKQPSMVHNVFGYKLWVWVKIASGFLRIVGRMVFKN